MGLTRFWTGLVYELDEDCCLGFSSASLFVVPKVDFIWGLSKATSLARPGMPSAEPFTFGALVSAYYLATF